MSAMLGEWFELLRKSNDGDFKAEKQDDGVWVVFTSKFSFQFRLVDDKKVDILNVKDNPDVEQQESSQQIVKNLVDSFIESIRSDEQNISNAKRRILVSGY
jgi:hypothetical protein